jgi:hypothetical protein
MRKDVPRPMDANANDAMTIIVEERGKATRLIIL